MADEKIQEELIQEGEAPVKADEKGQGESDRW